MLKSLYIENIILIEKCVMQFDKSMTCITGDSGSGKSIILDALNIILGDRASQSVIRDGKDRAIISAEFDISKSEDVMKTISDAGYETNGEFLIKKIINRDSSSKILLNDQPTSIGFIKEITSSLIQIHGQTDQLLILNQKRHKKILDDCIGETILMKEISKLCNKIKERIKEKNEMELELKRSMDILKDLEEMQEDLEKYDIFEGEEKQLVERRIEYLKSAKISNFIKGIIEKASIDGLKSAVSLFAKFQPEGVDDDVVKQISDSENSLIEAMDSVSCVIDNLSKISYDITKHFDFDISEIEERLEQVNDVCRKYRIPNGSLFVFIRENDDKINQIYELENRIKLLNLEIENDKKEYIILAKKISTIRQKSADEISICVNEMLKNLEMQDAEFKICVNFDENILSNEGSDEVIFMAMLNKGTKSSPINEIASGGEISRLILAIKSAIARKLKDSSVLIFDEIESGLSTNVSIKVSLELEKLAKSMQIIAITHNPYIAGVSDSHIKISKKSDERSTTTLVLHLDSPEERQEEIAQMISFDKNHNAIKMAGEILNEAKKRK